MSVSIFYQTLHLYTNLHYLQFVGADVTYILVGFEANEISEGETPKHANPVVSLCSARCVYFTPPHSKYQDLIMVFALRVFIKLQSATISFVISVYPSVLLSICLSA